MSLFDRIILTVLLCLAAYWACREADYQQHCRDRLPDILVSVSGEVKEPGVIRLPAGARVVHAVVGCGGFSGRAQTEVVPLARALQDGENLVVPRREEVKPAPVATPPAAHLFPGPAADPPDPHGWSPEPAAQETSTEAGSLLPPAGPSVELEPLDVNRATLEQLDRLPGVGPVTARRILQARQASPGGSFGSLEELRAIRGIKGKTFLRLKPYLKIEGP